MSESPINVLAVLLIAAGLAPPGPALGQGTGPDHGAGSCTPCHVCDEPSRADPCLSPCLRPGPRAPRPPGTARAGLPTAPGVIVLDELEDLYEAVPFDHAVHADMAALTTGCVACHHQTPEGEEHPACSRCHEPAPVRANMSMPGLKGAYHRQCMSCHREWSHDTACESCHRPKIDLAAHAGIAAWPSAGDAHRSVTARPTFLYRTSHEPAPIVTFHHADHAQAFGLSCVDCHRGESCGRCHDATIDATARRVVIDRRTRCFSCHRENDCGSCHDAARRPSFDHAVATGWSLQPHHAQVACTACHGSAERTASPSPVCHACHARRSAGAPGPQPARGLDGPTLEQCSRELDCLSCHEGMRSRLDRATVVHGPATGEAGCTSCHGGLLATSPRPPAERQKDLCLGCHDRQIETGRGRSLTNIAALLAEAPNHHGPIREGRCCACHQPHASTHARLLVAAYPPDFYATFEIERYGLCFGCHEEGRVLDRSGTGHTGFRNGDRNLHWVHVNQKKGRTCRACHEVHASSQPFHIREAVPFGASDWMMRIDYRQTADGGGRAPACHTPKTYHRSLGRPPGVALGSALR